MLFIVGLFNKDTLMYKHHIYHYFSFIITIGLSGFNKVSDKIIKTFFTKDNETIEEAKARLSAAASSKNSSLSKSDEE